MLTLILSCRWWDAFDKLQASWGDEPGWEVIEATVNRDIRRPELQ